MGKVKAFAQQLEESGYQWQKYEMNNSGKMPPRVELPPFKRIGFIPHWDKNYKKDPWMRKGQPKPKPMKQAKKTKRKTFDVTDLSKLNRLF